MVVLVDSVFVDELVAGVETAVVVFVVFVVLVSLVFSVVEAGFTTVVLFSVFFSAGAAGATVSVFCSQAPRRAALARMQINFFIVVDWLPHIGTKVESEWADFPALRNFNFRRASSFRRLV